MRLVPLALAALVLAPAVHAQQAVRDSLLLTRTIQTASVEGADAPGCRYTLVASHPDVLAGTEAGAYDYVGTNLRVASAARDLPEGRVGFASWQVEGVGDECGPRLAAFRETVEALDPWYALYDAPADTTDWTDLMADLHVPRVRSSSSPKNRAGAIGRNEYELRRLQDPRTGRIPENIRTRELAFAERVPSREEVDGLAASLFAETWAQRGPLNVGGRTRALAIDLNFNGASNQRVLAGGISGGMYLSENNGTSWRLTSDLSQFASVTALAQDPSNRSVWYYGTGELEGNSASGSGAFFVGEGIFKSTDGGETWAQLPSTAQGSRTTFDQFFDVVWNVAVHPTNGTVLAATYGAIMRSTDGGASWQQVLGRSASPFSRATDVTFASNGTAYAVLSRSGGGFPEYGVYRSTDGGATWTSINPPTLTADPYRMVVAAAPSDPNTAYVFVQKNQAGNAPGDHQLFRYNAASNTWTERSAGFPHSPSIFGGEFTTQGGYDMVVAVKPDDPNTVWIGGTNLYRSTDGGASFTWVAGYHADAMQQGQWPNHHPDQHRVVFYPNNPNAMISGHDGGLSVTTNVMQQPQTWTRIVDGYLTTQFYALAVDPTAGSELLVGGLQDNGTWLTESTSSSQDWIEILTGDGAFAAVAPGGFPVYASSQNGNVIRITQTAYSSVAPAGESNFLFITPYLLDPNDARVMYLAGGNAVWRNSNLDAIPVGNQPTSVNWTRLTASAVGTPSTHQVTALAVSTTPANRLYFGATDYQTQTVLKRVDNAASNPAGTVITPGGLTQGAYPSSIAVHPSNADEILATFSNYGIESVWHSTNGGTSWSSVEGNLGGADGPSVRWATIAPASSGTVYFLATSTGVYSTRTLSGATTTWAQEGASTIGNVVTNMIVHRPSDGLVVAGTHGRGAYSATLGQAGSAAASVDVSRLDIAAQPGATGTTSFTLRNTGSADLSYSSSATQSAFAAPSASGARPARTLAEARAALTEAGPPLALGQRAVTLGPGGIELTSLPDATLILDDGNNTADDFVGFGDGSFVEVANQFDVSETFQIERVRFYMRTESYTSNTVLISILDGSGVSLQEKTVELDLSPQGRWYVVSLDTPLTFNPGDTFYVDVFMLGLYAFPAGADTDAQVPNKSFYYDPDVGGYVNINTIPGFQNGAFLVRAIGTTGGANQPPLANGTISTNQPQVGQTVTFDASASSDPDGTIAGYLWSFGDGATSTQAVATHAYSAAGTYTVSLQVTDDDGDTGQVSAQLTVTGGGGGNQPPVARAQVSTNSAPVGQSISFNASTSSDPDGSVVGYLWSFGDGATSTQAVTTHAYAAAGTYTLTLTVTDNLGATGQVSGTITITGGTGPSRFTVAPAQGTVAPGGARTITVSFDSQGLAEDTYQGTVQMASNGGSLSIPVDVLINGSVAAEETPSGRARLAQNYPNPFRDGTTIRYELDTQAEVTLEVFDVTGRRVRVLDAGQRPAGVHTVDWDGRDVEGLSVASGLYLYRLDVSTPGGAPTRLQKTLVLVR